MATNRILRLRGQLLLFYFATSQDRKQIDNFVLMELEENGQVHKDIAIYTLKVQEVSNLRSLILIFTTHT